MVKSNFNNNENIRINRNMKLEGVSSINFVPGLLLQLAPRILQLAMSVRRSGRLKDREERLRSVEEELKKRRSKVMRRRRKRVVLVDGSSSSCESVPVSPSHNQQGGSSGGEAEDISVVIASTKKVTPQRPNDFIRV